MMIWLFLDFQGPDDVDFNECWLELYWKLSLLQDFYLHEWLYTSEPDFMFLFYVNDWLIAG